MNYKTYLEQAEELAKKQSEEYAAAERKDLAQYTEALKQTLQQTVDAKQQETAADLKAERTKLQTDLDKNEVEQYITQRNIRERLANLGLSHSGIEQANLHGIQNRRRTKDRSDRQDTALKSARIQADSDRYIADRKTETDQKIAKETAAYEQRIGRNLQDLLKQASRNATALYKSDNSIENYKLGLGAQGEVTVANMYSDEFIRQVSQRLNENEDPSFILEPLRRTLKYTSLSPVRIMMFLQKLHIQPSYQQFLAMSLDRQLYTKHWEEAKSLLAQQTRSDR